MPGVNATGLSLCQQVVLRQTELLNADLNRRVVLRSHVLTNGQVLLHRLICVSRVPRFYKLYERRLKPVRSLVSKPESDSMPGVNEFQVKLRSLPHRLKVVQPFRPQKKSQYLQYLRYALLSVNRSLLKEQN